MSEWINVSDDSPRDRQAVIVSDGVGVGVWRWRGFWPNHDGNSCCNENSATELLGRIIKWMPLPKP